MRIVWGTSTGGTVNILRMFMISSWNCSIEAACVASLVSCMSENVEATYDTFSIGQETV